MRKVPIAASTRRSWRWAHCPRQPLICQVGPTGHRTCVPSACTSTARGAAKVHNSVADGAIGWNTTAPTQSVTAGAGCGSLDNPLTGSNQGSVQDSHFEDTFAQANLDTMSLSSQHLRRGRASRRAADLQRAPASRRRCPTGRRWHGGQRDQDCSSSGASEMVALLCDGTESAG